MRRLMMIFIACFSMMIFTTSCEKDCVVGEDGEHSEEGESHGEGCEEEGEGDESSMKWAKTQTADETLNGVRLILNYDAATESFKGTVENTTDDVARDVRVEVHVFDSEDESTEYGPTTPEDLEAGLTREIELATPGADFSLFTMHPEVN